MSVDVRAKPRKIIKFSIADVIIVTIIALLCLTCILPFVHIAAKSLSSSRAVLSKEVFFWPIETTLESYTRVLTSSILLGQMGFTMRITIAQTFIGLIATALCAFPLSRRYLPGRFALTLIVMVTMYFSAGLIPTYMLYHDIGLLDTVWVLILPGAFSAYNMLIVRTFFMNSVPEALEEAAIIDGASHFRIFIQIWCPLSLPVFATISLWIAVARWNSYADAMWYTKNRSLQPLQYLLYNMILSARPTEPLSEGHVEGAINAPEALQAAAIMFSALPILLVYPFLQRYFVKGVTLGSVKG
jgi:putative aldouronate transport system permease protein